MVALNEKLMGRPGEDIRSTIDEELRNWSALCSLFVGFGVVGICCVSCATCCVMYSVLKFRVAYVIMKVYDVLTDTKLSPRNSYMSSQHSSSK